MTAPLYAIAQQYRADLDALADLDLDATTLSDTLEGMQGELHDKLRAVIAYSLELSILAAGAADAAKRMADRAKSLESRSVALQRYALENMQSTGTAQIATDEWAAKIAKTPPKVVISEGAELPSCYLRSNKTVVEPDKVALKQALDGGAQIDGVALVSGYRLAVR